MITDKAPGSLRRCVSFSIVVMLMALMFAAGCGNSTGDLFDDDSQETAAKMEKPKDLGTLLKSNKCESCDLSNWHFNQLDLSRSDLADANLANTTFIRSNLTNANLEGANLSGADLANAILSYANLTNANLENANLSGAKMFYSNLTGAKLDGAIFYNTTLTGATWIDGSRHN
jgi:uncharacterized protein YjbI with pentapeptide repeats